jgi:uncharacterized delta-60 repeat protein
MERKPLAETISLVAKAAAPATAVATSLAAPLAQAATGDLDPSFADHGRLEQILGAEGAVYSVEALENGGAFIGGGDFDFSHFCYFYYSCGFETSSFTDLIGEDGAIDHAYHALEMDGIQAFAFARQADGKVVAVGRRVNRLREAQNRLVVFRLGEDGSLDTGFGENGTFEWAPGEDTPSHLARSLVIDGEGRIVVAGARSVVVGTHVEGRLVVLRLLQDGSLDPSFAEAGVYAGPWADGDADVRIVRAAGGVYRVASAGSEGCAIVGLDADGALDAAFGNAGIAAVAPGGDPAACDSLEALADGGLLVAGSAAGRGFVARLLANGAPDPAFAADPALADALAEATSIRSAAGGKVLVAGTGVNGATIMRLQATGELDTLFGDGGLTWIDLPSDYGSAPVVRDIAARADGSVIAAGGDYSTDEPFVVRLLGDAGGPSAGVVSFTDVFVDPQESDGKAIIRLRRSGGRDGEISVRYGTIADGEATADADFTATSGTIHWADGDASEREIAVDIAQDDGPAEAYETFRVALDRVEGGAGLGAQYAFVTIQPDGSPWGQIELGSTQDLASEPGVAEFWVSRNYYAQGEVSVTVTVEGVSATAGEDFVADPVTLTWGPDDYEAKPVQIRIVDDSAQEDAETFRVALTNPTGGAILGQNTEHVVQIVANDAPPPPPRHGGGGAAGFLSLLLLGFAEAFRAARRQLRCRGGGVL